MDQNEIDEYTYIYAYYNDGQAHLYYLVLFYDPACVPSIEKLHTII